MAGGGLTQGQRVINLALHAEYQGALGVVVNAPTQNEVVRELKKAIDIPVVVTVVSDTDDIEARIEAGNKHPKILYFDTEKLSILK